MNNQQLKQSNLVLTLFVVTYGVYAIISAVLTSQNTGILKINTSDREAGIIVTQTGHQAITLSPEHGRIRLAPGSYQVVVTSKGKQAAGVARVEKAKTTEITLTPTKPSQLPSPDTIQFTDIDTLTESGLSSDQLDSLKQAFFNFKHTTQAVVIKNVYPTPHNPQTDDSFTITFDVTIDSTPYKAAVQYSDILNINLYLYDTKTGAKIFDSTTSTTSASDEGE